MGTGAFTAANEAGSSAADAGVHVCRPFLPLLLQLRVHALQVLQATLKEER